MWVDMTIDFYEGYRRDYNLVHLQKKHVRQFDHEFARASAFSPDMSVLELGCGNGLFLQYLEQKGVKDFLGIDKDPELRKCMPDSVANRFRTGDFWTFLSESKEHRRFDRVVLFDVLEHFPAEKGANCYTGSVKSWPPMEQSSRGSRTCLLLGVRLASSTT